MTTSSKQRLDKWLWYARVVKSRTLAQKLVASGVVRIDGVRIKGPDYRVTIGMVITMTVHERIRILKILDTGTRRGPAKEAALLYEDLSPPMPPKQTYIPPAKPGDREPGSGRPTKKERRETDRLRDI